MLVGGVKVHPLDKEFALRGFFADHRAGEEFGEALLAFIDGLGEVGE